MAKGNIGVTSNNIFPVIKKFLYSDHEIFLRELVSNAIDATQKLKTLSSVGEFKQALDDIRIEVIIDKKKKTLTVRDRGVGMTEEEIDKYINQIAFSGAEEFLNKFKDKTEAIIGHFGLGFYSSFMVADKVDIYTLSYLAEAKAVHWTCEGTPEYLMEETIKADRGTDVVLHINKEFEQYLEDSTIESLLKKYCKFLPIPIVFGKKKEWKDGKEQLTDEDNVINDTTPAWTRKPSELKEEDYANFYHELYPTQFDEPLFHIHLNVDYPFHLTGILYFPKIKNNLDVHRNKIQLYCNQVFVTDEINNIVPEYLTLLHGVIDSPDIPLNVSRSYLQSDNNVKKISSHITKKVADKLAELFKNERDEFQKKWDDVKLFIQYGMLSDEKFYDRATEFALFKNTENSYYTFTEYQDYIKEKQTDKDGNLIILYTANIDDAYLYINKAKEKGYDVLLMDGELDVHLMSQLEQKITQDSSDKKQNIRFARIDSDTIENLIKKDDSHHEDIADFDRDALQLSFETQLPKLNNVNIYVTLEQAGENNMPVFITQNEFMRRMKEMSAHQSGFNFYGSMNDECNLIINYQNPKIKKLLQAINDATKEQILPINETISTLEQKQKELQDKKKDKKEDEIPQDVKDQLEELDKQLKEERDKKRELYSNFAKGNDTLHQLIDIALLANGRLKGEPLSKFLERSINIL